MRVSVDLLRLDNPDHARAWSTYVSTGKASEVLKVLRDDRDRLYARVSEYELKLKQVETAIKAAEEDNDT